MSNLSKAVRDDRNAAFLKVFGGVNGGATKRVAEGNSGHKVMRLGKTARDKAKGHVPYTNNVRIWDGGNGKGAKGGTTGQWIKITQAA